MEAVTIYYHWRAWVCCRKELDNSQTQTVSVEPGTEKEEKDGVLTLFFVLICIPPFVNHHATWCWRANRPTQHPDKEDLKRLSQLTTIWLCAQSCSKWSIIWLRFDFSLWNKCMLLSLVLNATPVCLKNVQSLCKLSQNPLQILEYREGIMKWTDHYFS